MTNQAMIETKLKGLPSEDAATLLMETFPVEASNYSEAFKMMAHRSWKRPDQIRLARFYLRKMPFASSKPYEVFASFMSLPTLIAVVKEALPSKPNDRQFIAYHVTPVLKKNIKTESDRDVVNRFIIELDSDHVQLPATGISGHT
ncbi:hypothetical protein [Rugamonas rivuli]|uniref:Uncharacterized protein n=1 Tax=Rugamonas rivuli TaxID=2743358 RepID=A0A843SG95_9BURK|nr:hypothetical protein [Rugamonas rivuli]MQA21150.1 hypothetical protein [Rugamonas rivuli]